MLPVPAEARLRTLALRNATDNRLVADSLEAEWNNKLRSLAEAQEQFEQQTQKQRLLIDSQTREQLLSLAADFPRVWNDPSVEPRERKRILRLLVEDVTLINGERIQVHVRLRGGATRSLTLIKPLPIAQIRKTKSEVVAEIDALLGHYCDREVAEILNQQGRRTWQDQSFNLKKIAHIRQAFNLKCRYTRLRAKGLLTAKEMSVRHGVTVHLHPGSLFGIIPDWRSASSRNRVHFRPESPAPRLDGRRVTLRVAS